MNGHAHLSALMSSYPEVAILRRFSHLNVQNLLYLQAELAYLEKELRDAAREDLESGDEERIRFARDWYALSQSGNSFEFETGDGGMDLGGGEGCSNGLEERGQQKQWKTILKIRGVLKEYNEALAHHHFITNQLHVPKPSGLAFLQSWMKRPSMGNVYLIGLDSDTWSNQEIKGDLLSFGSKPRNGDLQKNNDNNASPFSDWIGERMVDWWHRIVGRYLRKPDITLSHMANSVSYSQSGISRLTSFVAIVLASMLPVGCIVVLYFINSDTYRLLTIALLTAAFSASVELMTSARLVDVFVATSAFTAVQVVFVSTQRNGSGG